MFANDKTLYFQFNFRNYLLKLNEIIYIYIYIYIYIFKYMRIHV